MRPDESEKCFAPPGLADTGRERTARGHARAARQENDAALIVGGLPVTCNLTLPVACVAPARRCGHASRSAKYAFEYSKYNGWPEVKESLMAGRIQAAYMLAPLVMDLADKGIPLKIVSLGHRSGAVIMVRTDSPYQHFRQLAGKRIAIPSRFAVDFLFLRSMLAQEGMTPRRRSRSSRWRRPTCRRRCTPNAVDAYCTGEPFGAAAQSAGYARPLRMTRDEWPKYICCVLTVREELIDAEPALVQDLVNQCSAPGVWLDQKPANREKAVQIAAGPKFFNQDPEDHPLRDAQSQRPRDLRRPADDPQSEFEELMQLSLAGRHHQASRSRTRPTWTSSFAQQRARQRRFRCEPARAREQLRRAGGLLALLCAGRGRSRCSRRSRRIEGRRVRPASARRRTSPARLGRRRAEAQQLSRQGRAAGIRLHVLHGRLPDDAGHLCGSAPQARPRRPPTFRSSTSPWIRSATTAGRLRKYLGAFDPTFVGGTGTPQQLAAVRTDYGITAEKKVYRRQLHLCAFLVHLSDRSRAAGSGR